MVPILLLLSACGLGIPISMNPSSLVTIKYFSIFIPLLIIIIFFSARTALSQFKQIAYVVDSGFLVTFVCGRKSWIPLDLTKVTKAVVGDIEYPETMQMQLTTRRGWLLYISNTEDMEAFVAAVGYYIPVEIERRREALPIWTNQSVTALAICSLFLVLIFAGFGYTLAQFI
jgi:hypothetical protein